MACGFLSSSAQVQNDRDRELKEADQLENQIKQLWGAQKFKDALPLAQKVVDIRQRLLSSDDRSLGLAYSNLGELYLQLKRYGVAENALKQALAIAEHRPDERVTLITILDRLTGARAGNGDYVEAQALYERSIALKEKEFGSTDSRTVHAMKEYACLDLVVVASQQGKKNDEKSPTEKSLRRRAFCWLAGFENDCWDEARIQKIESEGVINGKAKRLVTPPYPSAARGRRLSGRVAVAILIDVDGHVLEAKSVCGGNPEFVKDSEKAAMASTFTPTLVNGQPVKVSGVVIYNFVAQ